MKPGTKTSQAHKSRARRNNPYSTAVKTPDQIFRSIHECAEYYSVTPQAIKHRCIMGAKQRKAKVLQKTTHKNDWSGWELWGSTTSIPKRQVKTPLGTFVSLRQAGIAHGVGASTIRDRCNRGHSGYEFIDDKEDKE